MRSVINIAVIDSDAANRQTLRAILSALGTVQVFDSAESFLAQYPNTVDSDLCCLIVDAKLAGISGLQLLTTIRAVDVELPIIILASEAEVSLAVEAMRHGATDFIEKSQMDVLLLRRVSQLLRNSVAANSGLSATH